MSDIRMFSGLNSALDVSPEKRQAQRSKALLIFFFLAPGFLLLVTFLVIPIGQAAYYSLYNWNGLGPLDDFVALDNYVRAFSQEVFRGAIQHSLFIMVLSLAVQLPLAMTLALILIRGRLRFQRFFRTLFFLPYVFSEIVAAYIWLYVYNPRGGLLNVFLGLFNPEINGTAWLADLDTVLVAIFFVLTWKFFGFHMLLYMAGLQNISREVEDSARVSGANEWQVLRYVTLPMMRSTISLSVFLSILGSFQQFIVVWILTEGGPAFRSELIVTYLYKFGIQRMQLGFGSALAIILFLMTLIFSLGYQRTVLRQTLTE
ncbi:MAG: sugar ABC transporter permease [Ardenticatenaceae bacterium]|nr:sugar ABC transporter permease [Anaerolineales bacterium]MCB8978204.1 sugar ABC transporter permease [Ardenticatenaceae bacterium]